MDIDKVKRELIVKSALEVIENVMPTNILENLKQFEDDEEEDIGKTADDLDEDRFFHEFRNHHNDEILNLTSGTEPADNNDSLTYFEIVEQEMMKKMPVTKETIELLKLILGDLGEISQEFVDSLGLQTLDQLTHMLVYSLMSSDSSNDTEESRFLQPGAVNRLLETVCDIIAQKKDTFIQWPNEHEIMRSIRRFERYQENIN